MEGSSANWSNPIQYENSGNLRIRSETTQRLEGDCLPSDFVSSLPIKIHLDLRQNDLAELISIWKSWNVERREKFRVKYGDIAYLLQVEVDVNLIKAMIHFWDPSYRCFTFNGSDMVPTIEEYATLLRFTPSHPDKIYWKNKKTGYRKKLALMLGVSTEKVDDYVKQKGQHMYLPWAILRNHIKEQRQTDRGLSLVALAIYGLVLFPKSLGQIEMGVVDFLDQVEHKVDQAPTILAETIRSLNYSRRSGEGRFTGCVQLLYVWMRSHLRHKGISFQSPSFSSSFPLKEFCQNEWPVPKIKEEWIATLNGIESTEIIWRAPWMTHSAVLFSCGGKSHVPLLGLWGAVSYAPIMVRRQVGYEQFVPMTHGLNQLEFAYTEVGAQRKIEEVTKAWKQTFRVRDGRLTYDATPDYFVWHVRRGKDVVLPEVKDPIRPSEPVGPSEPAPQDPLMDAEITKRKLRDQKNELEQENERLRRRMVQLENKLKQSEDEIQKTREERDEWKGMSKNSKETLTSTTSELSRLQREIRRSQNDLQNWKRQYRTTKEERDSFQAAVNSLGEQLHSQQQAMVGLANDLELLQGYAVHRDRGERWRAAYLQKEDHLRHLFIQLNMAADKAIEMENRARSLREEFAPRGDREHRLLQFLQEAQDQYRQIREFLWRP